MLVKALVAEGKTDEEIAAQLVVTPEQAALMVTYCTKDTKPTSEPYMRLPFNWRETHLEHECRECLEHYGLSSLRSAALRRAAPR